MEQIDLVLDHTGERYVKMIDGLDLANLTTRYPFQDNDEFKEIFSENQQKGMQIYWDEILSRVHLCSVTGILRTRHWISSLVSATRDGNLLSFAAAFRGFIESVADSSSSLSIVPLTLARQHSDIVEMLSGNSHHLLFSSELEGELIHFAHARYLSASEAKNSPPHHKARRVQDYIDILRQGNVENVAQCYREMCDLTHPGRSSVWMWLRQTQNTVCLSADQGGSIISHCIQENRKTFTELLMFGFNPSILTLKVLNLFPISRLHTPQIEGWNLSSISGWIKCKNELRNSRVLRSKGLI